MHTNKHVIHTYVACYLHRPSTAVSSVAVSRALRLSGVAPPGIRVAQGSNYVGAHVMKQIFFTNAHTLTHTYTHIHLYACVFAFSI